MRQEWGLDRRYIRALNGLIQGNAEHLWARGEFAYGLWGANQGQAIEDSEVGELAHLPVGPQ